MRLEFSYLRLVHFYSYSKRVLDSKLHKEARGELGGLLSNVPVLKRFSHWNVWIWRPNSGLVTENKGGKRLIGSRHRVGIYPDFWARARTVLRSLD